MASAAGTRQTSSLGRVLVPGPKSRSHARPSTRPAPDPSVLRPSIGVSVTGMRQAVKLLEGATPEVRSYVLNECHLIYECKVCFNMFRSLANFIAHKRSYCQTKLQDVRHVYRREPSEYVDAEPETLTTAFVQPEPVETIIPDEAWDIDNYSPSLELLKEAGLIQEIENRPQVSRLRPQAKAGLDDVVQRLRTRQYLGPERDYFRDQTNHVIQLEQMKETSRAMFQTYGANPPSSMGERYHELERLRQKPCVFVGPDGKIVEPGVPPPNGNMNRLEDLSDFPCPLCHKQFEKLKGLSRHIIRIHKKTQEEATQIQRKSKRMVIARSRFCGLTPEELLKGECDEDMNLGESLKMGPNSQPSLPSTLSSVSSSSPTISPSSPVAQKQPDTCTSSSTSSVTTSSKYDSSGVSTVSTSSAKRPMENNKETSLATLKSGKKCLNRMGKGLSHSKTTQNQSKTKVKRLQCGPIMSLRSGHNPINPKSSATPKSGDVILKRKTKATKQGKVYKDSKKKQKPKNQRSRSKSRSNN